MRRIIRNLTLLLFHTLLFAMARPAAAEELNVYVDRSDPLIAVSRTQLYGNRLVVSGTAYDAWSGVKSVEASAEGKPFESVADFVSGSGGEWTYVYPVPETSARYGHFVFRAVDNAGNTAEIVRNDIEIYNKTAALIFPDYIVKGQKYVPEIQGDPVKAVVTVSGWGHDFNCPKCASQMKFDLLMDYQPPNTFVCRHCGATASGPAYDAAWVYYYRSHFGGMLADVSI